MTITRNGITFTLTPDELSQAYYEQKHLFDMEDVEAQCEELENEGRISSRQANKILGHPQVLSEVADEMRRNVDKYDMDWWYAAREAILATAENLDATTKGE